MEILTSGVEQCVGCEISEDFPRLLDLPDSKGSSFSPFAVISGDVKGDSPPSSRDYSGNAGGTDELVKSESDPLTAANSSGSAGTAVEDQRSPANAAAAAGVADAESALQQYTVGPLVQSAGLFGKAPLGLNELSLTLEQRERHLGEL